MVLLLIVIYLLCLVKFRVYNLVELHSIINACNSFIFVKFGMLFPHDLFKYFGILFTHDLFKEFGIIAVFDLFLAYNIIK